MELKTTEAQLAKYFRAWLLHWMNKNKYTQLRAAVRLGLTPGFINMIINNKRAASAGQMEKIAGAVNLDLLEILIHGRRLLAGEPLPPSAPVWPEIEPSEIGLSRKQIEALREYRALLRVGGEGVEVITEAIQALALKKKSEDHKESKVLITYHQAALNR
ncbi:MAG: helix-turn-helix domain-containing protein [Candidatus Adiutrix sp.]|jgi:transcriptional regulator with XRE-family HTH domain|nr:helix-turn-helix domain-containing protein [Candidatus Adiutrix sp.]